MEPIKGPNFKLITKAMENKWVAFSANYKKILAIGQTLDEAFKEANSEDAIFMRVLPSDVLYAPQT